MLLTKPALQQIQPSQQNLPFPADISHTTTLQAHTHLTPRPHTHLQIRAKALVAEVACLVKGVDAEQVEHQTIANIELADQGLWATADDAPRFLSTLIPAGAFHVRHL